MGSITMHAVISKKLQNKNNFSKEYMVGSVAPDILKNISNRKKTHYLKEYNDNGTIKFLPDIEEFIKINENKFDDYFFGYLVHLIEDKIWFDKYIPMFANVIGKEKVIYLKDQSVHKKEEFNKEIYLDYDHIDEKILMNNTIIVEELRQDVIEHFKDEKIKRVAEERIINNKGLENRQNLFITNTNFENYFNDCINECEIYLDKLKKGI